MIQEKSTFEKINQSIRNSITIKLSVVGILILLLMIPTSMIEEIIWERKNLNEQASHEASNLWAKGQQVNGPIMVIPLLYEWEENGKTYNHTKNWYVLPENLKIDGSIEPEILKRGIYEVVVYSSDLKVEGNFKIEEDVDQKNLKEIQYDKAFLTIGISDLRGIKNQIEVTWDKEQLQVKPGSHIPDYINTGVTVQLPKMDIDSTQNFHFSFDLGLQGSTYICFVPLGGTTKVNLNSTWNAPKFDGNFIPDNRDVTDSGFTADYTILQLNRNFPQSWVNENQSANIQQSTFFVYLLVPLDNYAKATRSSKYALMTIGLTFLIFFLVEIINKRKIHPFQYTLVGMALSLFYILLVSISEHFTFDRAFGISAVGIITMIGLYSMSVFKSKKLSSLLVFTLIGIYGFLFVTLQMADYALLMGGIGLTLILGATMYFTRKINWYKPNTASIPEKEMPHTEINE